MINKILTYLKFLNKNHKANLQEHMPNDIEILMPNFLVVGTQKGGTTTLQRIFEVDERIFVPKIKEVHYFTLHSDKSPKWYSEFFQEAKPNQLKGEITPYYLFHPMAAARIKKLIPNIKIIILLRDPVERALSQYFHAVRHGFETLDIEDAFKAEQERMQKGDDYNHQKHSYISRSRYIDQIDRYEALFPKEAILILKSEDLFNNMPLVWNRVQSHLSLEPKNLTSNLFFANKGQGEANQVTKKIKNELREKLLSTSLNVRERYGFDWGW